MQSTLTETAACPRTVFEKRSGSSLYDVPLVGPMARGLTALPELLSPTPGSTKIQEVENTLNSRLRDQAWDTAKRYGHVGLGLGAGAAGLYGLYHLLKRNAGQKKYRGGPPDLPLSYPVPAKEDPETVAAPNFRIRTAADPAGAVQGGWASTFGGIPWYYPAAVGLPIAGMALGWKGVDKLLQSARNKERESEVESAKQEFESALSSQYERPTSNRALSKAARLSQALDAIYEKRGNVDFGDLAGQLAGSYGVYALASGLGTGGLLYNYMRRRSEKAIMEKALKRREMQRFQQQPPEIYARPEPVVSPPHTDFRDEMRSLKSEPEPT